MTTVIPHLTRAGAGMYGSFRPDGWNPKLRLAICGPSPAGAQLVFDVKKPDGSDWFSIEQSAQELDEGEVQVVDFQRWEDETDIDEAGTAAFTVRLVSELDGIDELLLEGGITAVPLGDKRYAADHDWLASKAFLCLDTVDENDAPRLKVTVFLMDELNTYQVEAHCFHEGKRFAKASYVESNSQLTSNDGRTIGQDVVAQFDDVRGWNNLTDQGWGDDDWHLLDTNDGSYEVKFVYEGKVVRVVPFSVEGGRLVASGPVEPERWTAPVVVVDAEVKGEVDQLLGGGAPAFYGATGPLAETTLDEVYAHRVEPEVEEEPDFDEETTALLQAWYDRAERLVNSWESDMCDAEPPHESGLADQAEVVIWEMGPFHELRDAAAAVPDDYEIEHRDEWTTVGELHARVQRIGEAAEAIIRAVRQGAEDVLTPYRLLLSNDKAAIFEDHPAPDFRYQTVNGHVIETPEELAEAEYWFFEGVTEMQGTATVDGSSVKVTVQGWRVLGWKFDDEGRTLDEWEEQGQGMNAPKGAFAAR